MKLKTASIGSAFLGLIVLSTTLLSFSKAGGDHFEIYLNKKMVLQQFVHNTREVKSIHLNPADTKGEVEVFYSHCGQLGKERAIIITDSKNKMLKSWKYSDLSSSSKFMSCQVKDLVDLQKNTKGNNLKLFYSSREIPKGKQLATITFGGDNSTAKN